MLIQEKNCRSFSTSRLYVVTRCCRVLTERPCSNFLRESTDLIECVEDNVPVVDEGLDPIELVPNMTGNLREDIVRLTLDGFEVDDYNEPA